MTWKEMVKIEPHLAKLLKEAKSHKGGPGHRCANDIWYDYGSPGMNGLKSDVHALVGWEAQNRLLSSSRCYDIAYQKIYSALPDCGDDCECQGGGE